MENYISKNTWKTLIFALLCTATTTIYSLPGEKYYQVELLIFSHLTPQALQSEKWPILSNTIQPLVSPNPPALVPLENENFTLKREEKEISKQPNYQVLLHTAWEATANDLASTKTLHIYGGNAYDNSGDIMQINSYETTPYNPNLRWQLNGAIKINVARYFNVQFNLLLSEPTPLLKKWDTSNYFENWEQPFFTFQLLQNRRMRSDELNYIGHPLFGALIKITPMKKLVVNTDNIENTTNIESTNPTENPTS